LAFNRTIWTLWLQGFDVAPTPVPLCLASWRFHNPDWTIHALDARSLGDWIDIRAEIDPDRPDVTPQKVSNAARLALLRKYGGVWTDPTVFCRHPLDSWLPAHSKSGFYAFRGPFSDRLIDNWFIAAEPDNPLLVAMYEGYRGLWRRHRRFRNQNNEFGRWAVTQLEKVLGKSARRSALWTNPLLLDVIGAYPYAIFTYLATAAMLRDPRLRQIWEDSDPIDWRVVLPFVPLPRTEEGIKAALAIVDAGDFPVAKLTHHRDYYSTTFWPPILERMEATLSARPRG